MILDGLASASIATAVQRIKSGELLGLPTETVYGLAADAENDAAVGRIFSAKGRPADHPLIVHLLDAASVSHFAEQVPEFAQRLMHAFWPGPLTLILPRRPGVATAAAAGQNSIGLRCPSHPVAQALLRACLRHLVWGLAAPSANQFGRVSPTTAEHVQGEFGPDLLILDGGPCQVGIESTIIDCTRSVPVLLRPGAIGRAQVQAVCRQPVLTVDQMPGNAAPAPRAPGTLEAHYAPNAKLRLMQAGELLAALDLLDGTAPFIGVYSRAAVAKCSATLLHIRMPADAGAAAQQLFATLREFDAHGVKLIWIERPPDGPEWDAVRDRLQRAAAA